MKYPKIRKPIAMPKQPRFETRAELEDGTVDTIGTGHHLNEEVDSADFYARRTGRKVWTIDLETGRTVHRRERVHTAGGPR
jgi:hypothetical protein